MNFDALLVVCL